MVRYNTQASYQSTNVENAKVEIHFYNKKWPALYQKEKKAILEDLNPLIKDIQHIGSTSIPGLAAKPTIDICIGVEDLTHESVKDIIFQLEKLGYDYLHFLEQGIPERRYLQKVDEYGNHLVHIHIVDINGEIWNNYISFRDYLIEHPLERSHYEKLKLYLKDKFHHDREKYTDSKSAHIKEVLHKAKKWAYNKLHRK
ncbi:MAG: GrpB family protein [Burkholderiales bacterium]